MYAFKRIYVCGYITSRDGIEWKLKKKIGEIFSENIILSAEEVYLEMKIAKQLFVRNIEIIHRRFILILIFFFEHVPWNLNLSKLIEINRSTCLIVISRHERTIRFLYFIYLRHSLAIVDRKFETSTSLILDFQVDCIYEGSMIILERKKKKNW